MGQISHEVIMSVIIREASRVDAPAAKACVAASFELYIARIGKPPAPMLLDFAAEIEARRVWVAEVDGNVAGVLVQYETEQGFYIDTVAVAPDHQGAGVGKALLQFAEQEALRRGYDSLYLCTNTKMTENQIFYPRIGYVEYDRKLDDGYDRVFYRKSLIGMRDHQKTS
jgi:GNAT superfamily N-acetyltransferase